MFILTHVKLNESLIRHKVNNDDTEILGKPLLISPDCVSALVL